MASGAGKNSASGEQCRSVRPELLSDDGRTCDGWVSRLGGVTDCCWPFLVGPSVVSLRAMTVNLKW